MALLFDSLEPEQPTPAPAPEPQRTVLGTLGDIGVSALKSAVAVPEAALGLADLATGGKAGQIAEGLGIRTKDAHGFLDTLFSEPQKQAFRNVQDAEGVTDTALAVLQNPSTIAHNVIQSLGLMGAGGVVGRGIASAGARVMSRGAAEAGSMGPYEVPGYLTRAMGRGAGEAGGVAGALGEGAIGAGSSAEQYRQDAGSNGTLTGQQAGLAVSSGAIDTLFAMLGGRVAHRLGFQDPDTMLALAHRDPVTAGKVTKSILGGIVSEGLLEELPQGVGEQVMQNLATSQPIDKDVDQNAVLSFFAGAAMGGAANAHTGRQAMAVSRASDAATAAAAPAADQPAAIASAPPAMASLPARDETPEEAAARDARLDRQMRRLAIIAGNDEESIRERRPIAEVERGIREQLAPQQEEIDFLKKSGAESAAAALQKRLDAQVNADLSDIEIQRLAKADPRWGSQDFSDLYVTQRQQGAAPADAAAHAAGLTAFLQLAQHADLNAKALNATFEKARGLDVAELPAFLDVAMQGFADAGMARPLSGVGDAITAFRDDAIRATMDKLLRPAPAPQPAAAPEHGLFAVVGGKFKPVDSVQDAAKYGKGTVLVDAAGRQVGRVEEDAVKAAATTQDVAPPPDASSTGASAINLPRPTSVDVAAHEAHSSPLNDKAATPAQILGGNAELGHVKIGPLDVSIENPAGSERRDLHNEPPKWTSRMQGAHYGYVKGTEGADGDHVDVFVKEGTPADYNGPVYVVDQVNRDGSFDEHKAVIGAASEQEARDLYLAQYEKGWKGLGAITEFPNVEAFDAWAKNGTKAEPLGKIARPQQAAASDQAAEGSGEEAGSDARADRAGADGGEGAAAVVPETDRGREKKRERSALDIARELGRENADADVAALRRKAVERVTTELGKPAADEALASGGFMRGDDLTQALHAGQYEAIREFAASMPVPVHESDIPADLAARAFSGTSHTPEARGAAVQREYVRALVSAWKRAAKAAGDDAAALARVTEQMQKLRDGYAERLRAYLASHSNVASTMIAGPAKFPTERNRKRSEAADRKAAEADEFLKKGVARMLKAAQAPVDNSPEGELARIRANLQAREREQEQMRKANAALRKGDDEALRALGFSDERIAELKKPGFAGRAGFPDYRLANNSAEIRRLKTRLAEAEARATAAEAGPTEREYNGVRIEENAQDDRLRLHFDGKPDEAVRADLKANGFKWSPRANAWQRQLTNNARVAAEELLGKHFAAKEEPSDDAAVFSQSEEPAAGMTADEVQAIVDRLTANWERRPPIVVIGDMRDAPDRVREQHESQLAMGGAGDVEGFFYQGKVWIVADVIDSPADVQRVLAHEALGHFGLRGFFGDALRPALNEILLGRRKEVERKAEQYGLDMTKEAHRYLAAEEVLAEMAQTQPTLGVIRRAVAAIKTWLREHGWDIALSDDEIIRDFILPARGWVERGRDGLKSDDALPAFARGTKPVGMPDVVIAHPLGASHEHADYTAAKAGDREAALRLARDLVTDDVVQRVRAAIGDSQPTVVPVNAIEAAGRNKIPLMVAEVLAHKLGLQTSADIVQSVKANRGGAAGLDRIFKRVDFQGDVAPGDYLIIDDTLTQGGTLAALAHHIESNGGRVVGALALTGKQYSAKIRLAPETLAALREKYGDIEPDFQAATGHGFDALTESEARYLNAFKPAEQVRARIAQERDATRQQLGEAAAGQDEGVSAPERTVQVDGQRYPAENSQGHPVHPSFLGQVNFWRWFKGSKVVDQQGRPLVMYHGTNKSQEGEAFTMFDTYASNYGLMGQGGYFTADPAIASDYTKKGRGESPTVYPVYLSIKNPLDMEAKADADAWTKQFPDADAFHEEGDTNESWYRAAEESIRDQEVPMYEGAEIMQDGLRAMGFDGITHMGGGRVNKDGPRHRVYVAFDPEQIKSAIGNNGEFSPESPDIMFSLATNGGTAPPQQDLGARMRNAFNDWMASGKTFNWWDKSIGTQYHKAQKHAGFKKVFDLTQDYLLDVSRLANQAADEARDILPHLDSFADLAKDVPLLDRARTRKADREAVAKAIFTGTLRDERVYTPEELKREFELTDKQVGLYQQFRAAVDKSLDSLGASIVARLMHAAGIPVGTTQEAVYRGDHKGLVTRMEALAAVDVTMKDALEQMREVSQRIDQLKREGYAPLMRFGQYAVSLRDPAGELEEFHLFESEREANRKARELREAGRGIVDQSIVSQKSYQLLDGLSPDTLQLFGDILAKAGFLDANDATYQQYLREAIAQHSAMKRLMHRKGYPGYSGDIRRVLAAFVTSNARLSSKNLYFNPMKEAAENIPQGDVQDEAVDLLNYVQKPVEEAPKIRALLFAQYIGGSAASALVNLTQTLTMSYPYLSQFGGPAKAAARVAAAMKAAAVNKPTGELKEALHRAELEGVVSPQEIHMLNAEAMGTFSANPVVQKLMFVWGSLFSLAEQYNRRAMFMAAWQTAVEEGERNPYAFAVKAIEETQGIYNRGNRPNWARGALGATLFTFKQFSISYLEFLSRLPAREKALALAILMLAAGGEGLPFSDDLDDVIDTIAQRLGYAFNSKQAKRRFLADTLGMGKDGAEFVLRGASTIPGWPIDVSARMGMANLIPGTGILRKDTQDHMRDVVEFGGPAASLVQDATKGNFSPVALRNLAKAADMFASGQYRDDKGRKVLDVDAFDAAVKGIGFQPRDVADESLRTRLVSQNIRLAKAVEAEIADEWARGRLEKDENAVDAARQRLRDWNTKNPDARIEITPGQLLRRIREMRTEREARVVKSAPKEQRANVRAELAS